MADKIRKLISTARAGDFQAFAKLLSAIEQMGPKALGVTELLEPKRVAFRVGITGPPGSGKSTLIGQVLSSLKKSKLRIGVLAVDPTSPISQGAILGDRIRYSEQALAKNVFVRSLGTRGSLGGLAASSYLLLRAFDACDFDLVLVETVGVGQVEVEIMNVADRVVLVLVPESGDSVQAMKAGIIEIADLFVVNKSDRPGAENIKRELEASIEMGESSKKAEVILTSALEGSGVDLLTQKILDFCKAGDVKKQRVQPARLRAEARSLERASIEEKAAKKTVKIKTARDLVKHFC